MELAQQLEVHAFLLLLAFLEVSLLVVSCPARIEILARVVHILIATVSATAIVTAIATVIVIVIAR